MNKVTVENDMSMEEALASIRQIINNDMDTMDNSKEAFSTPTPYTSEDVLDLTDVVTSNGTIIRLHPPQRNHSVNNMPDIKAGDDLRNPDLSSSLSLEDKDETKQISRETSRVREETILSQDTVKKSLEALKGLDRIHDKTLETLRDGSFGEQTMEEFVVNMIRPLLKTWLDTNLPSLVKWVVTEQIEQLMKEQQKNS